MSKTTQPADIASMLSTERPLLLVGAGKMGGAMLAGWIAGGLHPSAIRVQDDTPSPETMLLCAEHMIPRGPLPKGIVPHVIIMAVKPQIMDQVFPPIAQHAGPETITLSVAAGKTLASFEAHLPANAAVARAMPNTPALIGRGMTVLCANTDMTPSQKAMCSSLMGMVSTVAWIDHEHDMDAVTAVSGSGPAYVFLLAEAMTQAGIKAGLSPDLAAQLAKTTIWGSAELMWQAPQPPAQLREDVTSPGGTTAAALAVLMAADGLPSLMERAVAAAVARGRELSQ
jgi:pyrroline-5-carboxylate reductase